MSKSMKIFISLLLLLIPNLTFGIEKADMVLVVKSESKLYLMDRWLYSCEKQRDG